MLSLDQRKFYNIINFNKNKRYSNESIEKQRQKRNLFQKLLHIQRVECELYDDTLNIYKKEIKKKPHPKLISPPKKERTIPENTKNDSQGEVPTNPPISFPLPIVKLKASPKKDKVKMNSSNDKDRKCKVSLIKKIIIQVPENKSTVKVNNISANNLNSISKKLFITVGKKKEMKKIPLLLLNNEITFNNDIESIKKYHSYTIESFPFNMNPKPIQPNPIYNYTINKVYRDQFVQYFSHRVNWVLINPKVDKTSSINFQWKYLTCRTNFAKCKYDLTVPKKKLRIVNLFERNYELGNKKNLFINLINYCDKINVNVFEIIPFTIVFSNNKNFELGLKVFHELFEFLNENYTDIANKNLSQFFINKLYKTHFNYDSNFNSCDNTYINFPSTFISNKNYWIIKPVNLYQGKCIEISDNFNEISKICLKMFRGVDKTKHLPEIKEQQQEEEEEVVDLDNSNGSGEKKKKYTKMYCSNDIVLQKYLDNPLLYQKRKFDIRCYVLVDYNFNVFYCKEGHLKSSSEEYDLNVTNKFVHITNHSLQKKSQNFAKYEYGNEMSYQDFRNYLTSQNISLDYFDKMIERIKFLIEVSMNAVGKKITKAENILSFEVFGYDFILDANFKPYILEINSNPGLGISSPVIERLVPRMLDDAFRLTIDKLFETKYDDSVIEPNTQEYISKYHIDGYKDNENIFEFICNVGK